MKTFIIDELSARVLMDAVNRITGLRAGPGIVVQNSPSGITVSLARAQNVGAGFVTSGDLFPVNLTSDGGSAGNSTTQCSFTYTVKDLSGNTLIKTGSTNATTMSPAWARPALGKLVAATHGTAYRDSTGTLVLYQVDEVDATVARSC